MRNLFGVYVPAIIFVGTCVVLYVWPAPLIYLTSLIHGQELISYVIFVLLLAAATVFVPITAMPLIPMVAPVFGPFATGILSICGWTLGASIAFGLSRLFGRPLLGYLVPLDRLDEAVAQIPSETRFATMVLIRMTLPIDVMSYALGLSRSISFWSYFVATVIGVTWFSFVFSYMGSALFAHDREVMILLSVSAVVLFVACWAILIRHIRRHRTPPES